ncbi:hypothetical protein [Streptomyces rhizosphaerihabitans]|uniref:hypothetical protein n=1 Tax=Streptomyces rhizosphaerihabitans TaxID=1266770 RepID=UPI0021C0706B|nr:hypothetical protein [Streptomyces rhizosphaerihabitans]MCT9003508.1 hypothetical protein [Streptomyces rhizosphaerihabitans]
MPHPTTARPLRQALQPMIAGAILASTYPGLAADGIEVDHLGIATGDAPLGLRVFLYHPGGDVYEQWARAIDVTDFGTPRPTSRPGELSHTMTGRIGATPVEVTCVSLHGEWVWRTSTGSGVHKRDRTKDGTAAACGDLITGVADPAHWETPAHRCPGCASAETARVGVQ